MFTCLTNLLRRLPKPSVLPKARYFYAQSCLCLFIRDSRDGPVLPALGKTTPDLQHATFTAATRWPTNFYYFCDNDFTGVHITLGGACVGGGMTGSCCGEQ